MPKLQSGYIDHEVQVRLHDEGLEALSTVGKVKLDWKHRDSLRNLAFSWLERRSMIRPDYARVRDILDRLAILAAKDKPDEFLALVEEIASCPEESHPAEAFVYDAMLSELKIHFEPAWREGVRNGRISLAQVRGRLAQIRDRLGRTYKGKHGRSRDHDLGWVIVRLAEIYEAAGGKITASSRFNPKARPDQAMWYDDSDLIRLARAFVEFLPHKPGVDVGNLVHRALPYLRDATRA